MNPSTQDNNDNEIVSTTVETAATDEHVNTAAGGNTSETTSDKADEQNNEDDSTKPEASTPSVTGAASTNNKKRKRSNRPRKRDSKAPKAPRTALELFILDCRRKYLQKKHSSIPKDFVAKKTAVFERLTFQQMQPWKVAETRDLLRYQEALARYEPPDGYDHFGNLIHQTNVNTTTIKDQRHETASVTGSAEGNTVDENEGNELSSPNKMPRLNNMPPDNYQGDNTGSIDGSNHSSMNDLAANNMPPSASLSTKVKLTPSSHLTMATASFNDLVYELIKFKINKGHVRVPVKKAGPLGRWIERLRKEYKKFKSTQYWLNSASGMETVAAEDGTNNDTDKNSSIQRSEQKTNNNNSNNNDPVASYMTTTHDNLRLDPERVQVLTHLGMVWEFPNEDYEEIWQNSFQELVKFKEEHGHCNVPQKGHGKLSWWVKIQRELYVNTTNEHDRLTPRARPRQTMPHHRIRQLESIGFEWRVRPPALKWEDRYQELLQYKADHGDANVPQNHPPNRVLGKWVMKQRGFYYDKIRGRKSPLTKERQEKLEAIGFSWVAPHVCKTKAKLPLRENIVQQQVTEAANAANAAVVGSSAPRGGADSKGEGSNHSQSQHEQQPMHHFHDVGGDPTGQYLPQGVMVGANAASPGANAVAAGHHTALPPHHYQPSHHSTALDQNSNTHQNAEQHHHLPPQQQLQHLMHHYGNSGQVAASTYPYLTNAGPEQQQQSHPLPQMQHQQRQHHPEDHQTQYYPL